MILDKVKAEEAEKQIFLHQQEVAYNTRELTIEIICSKYEKGLKEEESEIYVPDYQREFVWDIERQSKFIESVILGLPIPFIFIAEMENGRFEIVDGSQRIRTLEAFLKDKLTLKGLDMLDMLNGFKFSDLSIPRQRKFRNTVIRMVVLSDKTTEAIRTEMFKRINRGSDILNNMEVRKGLLKGDFGNFIQELGKDELFKQLYPLTELAVRRQERQEVLLRFFAFSEEYPNYKRGLGKFLDTYLEKKNKSFTLEDRNSKLKEFNEMLMFVEKHFPRGFVKPISKISFASKIYFESISVGVSFAIKENPSLLEAESINLDWLNSPEFKSVIEPVFNTHPPKGIARRIELVRDSLLGKLVDMSEVLDIEDEE
jgi:hypothetical protein